MKKTLANSLPHPDMITNYSIEDNEKCKTLSLNSYLSGLFSTTILQC